MSRYTMRATWPDKDNDYVFRVNSRDAGRCYQSGTPEGERWLWTIYGRRDSGMELTLSDAQMRFKEATERAAPEEGRG